MSVLIRTNLGNLRVTVTRPYLTGNQILWSVVQNPDRCSVGGFHADYTGDDGFTHCDKCDRIAEIQSNHPLGHGFLYGSLTDALDEALCHAENVKGAADNLDRVIAMPHGPSRRLAMPRALRIYNHITA